MKRLALLLLAVALLLPAAANAQLTMQMPGGWSFTFAGNVNTFLTYEKEDSSGASSFAPGGIVGANPNGITRIRTGLLPAFAVFEAKGKEGSTDLAVHFGFAPQVNCAGGVHDCFGAQIDMRQVYLTVGGTWGSILAGRELGLFGRQNILTDQTLYGIGATGGSQPDVFGLGVGAGTTLGRIGFGYIYPQFKAQMTYSSPAGRPAQISIGLFEAASNGPYVFNQIPRIETEVVWSQAKVKVWGGALLQSTKTGGAASQSAGALGLSGGARYSSKMFSVTGSGYYGMGLGTTLLFLNGTDGTGSGTDDLRTSYGYIGQVTVTPTNSKVTLAGSYGASILQASDAEAAAGGAPDFKTENGLISGGIYFQATKSLKVVGEFNYAWTKETVANPEKNSSFAPAFGLMLFF